MAKKPFTMGSDQIARIVGTVGSPLIVIAELLKNAVDASASKIDIFYNTEEKSIIVENDHKGFSIEEIESLSMPGLSSKKTGSNLKNEHGLFLTGSKGLGLLSVFLLCNEAEIYTTTGDHDIYKIILDKLNGTVENSLVNQKSEHLFTQVLLKNVNSEVIDFLSSESEVRKLRHICTNLYKQGNIFFPKITLHINGQNPQEINFACDFPPMLYDVHFNYQKNDCKLHFLCISPNKTINNTEVEISRFGLTDLQAIMLSHYEIKETIPTRTNGLMLQDFTTVPSFEGRILVYEKNLAGAKLKTYGAGVNIYVNDFALYNYLAEENDWLELADYSQRKKVTRLKPHNVFGYVNFPNFNENREKLQISNERADFIQDLTFNKLMYLLKGVVMFVTFNIDVADKNPKYKINNDNCQPSTEQGDSVDTQNDSQTSDINHKFPDKTNHEETGNIDINFYAPENAYKPGYPIRKHLDFTNEEGQSINKLKGNNNLSNKIYNIVFELSKLDLQTHRYSIACLYRTLIECSTKYISVHHPEKINFIENRLETTVLIALNYFGNNTNKDMSSKEIQEWRDIIGKQKLIDTLNNYIHNESPVDAFLLQETWNSMKGYIMACLHTP
jgi:hypothetical protein